MLDFGSKEQWYDKWVFHCWGEEDRKCYYKPHLNGINKNETKSSGTKTHARKARAAQEADNGGVSTDQLERLGLRGSTNMFLSYLWSVPVEDLFVKAGFSGKKNEHYLYHSRAEVQIPP